METLQISISSPENLKSTVSEAISTPSEIIQQMNSPKEFISYTIIDSVSPQETFSNPLIEKPEEKDEIFNTNSKLTTCTYVQTSPMREIEEEQQEEENNYKACDMQIIKLKSNRGRKKKDAVYIHPVQCIGENLLQAYGSVFIIKKINKKSDDDTIVRCDLCQRDFRKKSIRSHTVSIIHRSKLK